MECAIIMAALGVVLIGPFVVGYLVTSHRLKETEEELRYLDAMERMDQIRERWAQKYSEDSYMKEWRD